MMEIDHNLNTTLVDIAENLREKDVNYLKFLCHDTLPAGEIEKCNGLNIIDALSNNHIISSNDYKFLSKCLKKIHRIDLLKKLNSGSTNVDDFLPNELNPFRSLLFDLALDLRSEEVKKLRFFYRRFIKESNLDALSIFTLLLEGDIINERSFENLVTTLSTINRKDLASKLEEYCRYPVEQRRLPIPESRGRTVLSNIECLPYAGQMETQISQQSSGSECEIRSMNMQLSLTPSSPEEKLNAQPSSASPSQMESQISQEASNYEWNRRRSKEYYRMESVPRGFCVIINNIVFTKGSHREGADVDQNELQRLFENFGFIVKIHQNLSSTEMKECLKKYSDEDHQQYDCFVCFLLSHGAKDAVYGSDSQLVMINELIELFNTDKCPSLKDKPKLFFIQACQKENDQKDCSFDAVGRSVHYQNPVIKADFSVFMSTVPGYYSFRCPEQGCRFIKHITNEFSINADAKDLLEMITAVIKCVAEEGFEDKQLPSHNHQLRKSLRFI